MLFSTIAFEPLLHHSRCGGADLVLRFEVDSLRLQGAMIDARIDIERDEPFVDMLRPGLAPMGQQFGAVPITELGTELGPPVFADSDLVHLQHDMSVRPCHAAAADLTMDIWCDAHDEPDTTLPAQSTSNP